MTQANATTGAVNGAFPGGIAGNANPSGIAISSDGKDFYLADFTNNTVKEYDATAGAQDQITTFVSPAGLSNPR